MRMHFYYAQARSTIIKTISFLYYSLFNYMQKILDFRNKFIANEHERTRTHANTDGRLRTYMVQCVVIK